MRKNLLLILLFFIVNLAIFYAEWFAFMFIDPIAFIMVVILHLIILIYSPYNLIKTEK